MAVVTTNLGTVTAYGDAVAAGYTGTKAQWQALMADYATVGQQAAQSAQTASTAASNATTAATTATTAAQTATTKASEASASATAAAASAASIGTPDTTLTQSGKAADAKATGDKISEIKEDFTDMVNSAYVTDSASGSVAHFTDGANNVPLKSIKVNIVPVQSGSGDPSPDNVRPISGFSSVKVMRTGKNLLKNSASSTTISGVTFTVNGDGSVTVNGTNSSSGTISFHLGGNSGTFLALPEGSYTLSGCPSGGGATSYFLSLYHHGTGGNNFGRFDFGGGQTYELTAETNTGLGVRIGVIGGATVNNLTFYPMLRPASDTDGTYEPYNGNTYTISLSSAGTVYGGTLDVTSGELTVTHNVTNLNGSENGWFKSGITTVDVYCLPLTNNSLDGDTTLSHFNYVNQRNYNTAGCAWFDSDGKQLRIGYATSGTDLTAFKAWLASNNVQLFSKLDNPLTYHLTPAEIKSLLGINNIWSDAGDVEVEYRADTKLYIKRLTDSDTDMISDANIVSGQYFMVGNDLYKATVNIASGAQIVVGTNATKVSLSEALNEINA